MIINIIISLVAAFVGLKMQEFSINKIKTSMLGLVLFTVGGLISFAGFAFMISIIVFAIL